MRARNHATVQAFGELTQILSTVGSRASVHATSP